MGQNRNIRQAGSITLAQQESASRLIPLITYLRRGLADSLLGTGWSFWSTRVVCSHKIV